MTVSVFKYRFLQTLDQMIAGYHRGADRKKNDGEFHESILDRIRLNVTTVFRKMFELSFQSEKVKLYGGAKKIAENYDKPYRKGYHLFLHRLDLISRPWHTNLEKATEFDDLETCLKEKAKLEVMEQIKSEFLEMYEKTWGAES